MSARTPEKRSVLRASREVVLWVGAVLGVLCILASVLSIALDVRPFVFRSGSMAPSIDTGALGIGKETSGKDLRAGDVISVVNVEGVRITHRIVEIAPENGGFRAILKGDANRTPDAEPYRLETAYRIIADIPKAGYVVNAMAKPPVIFVGGAIVALILMSAFLPGKGGSGGGRRKALAVVTAISMTSAGASSLAVPGTLAYFSDTSTMTTASITAYTVPKPVWVSCTVTGAIGKTVTIVWQEVSSPIALDYTAVVDGGPSLTVTDNGSTRQVAMTSGLLGIGTFTIRVTAQLPAPYGLWKSADLTQSVTFVTSLIANCGAHN